MTTTCNTFNNFAILKNYRACVVSPYIAALRTEVDSYDIIMAKYDTEFSKYAQAFHEEIDGKITNFDIFTKDLLKMGLTDNDKAYIDDEFPTFTDEKGKRHIYGNKGDVLRKYYGGTNDLSRLLPELETEFNSDFQQRYCEELQDYEESRIIEFAHSLH